MKRRLILLTLGALTACCGGGMSPATFAEATAWCNGHGGLAYARATVRSREYYDLNVTCVDRVSMTKIMRGQP